MTRGPTSGPDLVPPAEAALRIASVIFSWGPIAARKTARSRTRYLARSNNRLQALKAIGAFTSFVINGVTSRGRGKVLRAVLRR